MAPTVLVTGATARSGPAVVAALERDGWEVARAARSLGHDLADPAAVKALVDGLPALDAVAHLVGGFRAEQPVADTSLEEFRDHWDLHVATAYNVAHAAIPRLRPQGAMVLVASRAALRPFAGGGGYASAKAAEIALAQAIDAEGVRCNVVAPVQIDDQEAFADVVAWLCGPGSRALRGQVVITSPPPAPA
jgi:NAD(P)-dependent dehydrogenase (short-subunit alcohol dehydrogenase family)